MANLAMVSFELIRSLVNFGRDCVLCAVATVSGLTGGEPTEDILDDLEKGQLQAQNESKNVLVIYKGHNWQDGNPVSDLLMSPAFRALVKADYVCVSQMPGETDEMPTTLVFTDEKGRPYYSIDSELASGLDWLEVELQIAKENRKNVIPLLDHLPDKITSEADFKLVGLLIASLPDRLISFYEPYEKLMNSTLADDTEDMSGLLHMLARKERQKDLNDSIWRQYKAAQSMGQEARKTAIQELDRKVKNSNDATPFLRQLVAYVSQVLMESTSGDKRQDPGNEIDKTFDTVINLDPASKFAENIRLICLPAMKVVTQDVPAVKSKLAEAKEAGEYASVLQLIDTLEQASPKNNLRMIKQYYDLLRVMVYCEAGDEARALECAEHIIALDPSTSCSKVARRVWFSLKPPVEVISSETADHQGKPTFEWRDDDFQIPRFEASINWGMKCPKVLLPITDEASVK
jgi:hypothetical protein